MKYFELELPSGSTLFGIQSREQVSAMGALIGRGSIEDDPKYVGASHFLEHLLFRSQSNSQHSRLRKKLSYQGGTVNAITDLTRTMAYAQFPHDATDTAIQALTQLLRKPEFAPNHVDLERNIILREMPWRADDINIILDETLRKAQYIGNPSLPETGKTQTVNSIPVTYLEQIWRDSYHSKNITFGYVGPKDPNIVAVQLNDSINKFCQSSYAKKTQSLASIKRTTSDINLTVPGIELSYIGIGFHAPLPSDPMRYAQQFMMHYLAKGEPAYLFDQIREKRGKTYQLSGDTNEYPTHADSNITTSVFKKDLDSVMQILLTGFEKVANLKEREFQLQKHTWIAQEKAVNYGPDDFIHALLYASHEGRKPADFFKRFTSMERVTREQVHKVSRLAQENIAKVVITPAN